MNEFTERPDFYIEKFSDRFKYQFVECLTDKYAKGKWINVNHAYNEMIRDSKHVHLNATRWTTLGAFVSELCKKDNTNF